MSKRAIPLVDLSSYINGDEKQQADFVKQIGDAFHNVGFVGVINHGIPQQLIDNFYKYAYEFF